MGDDANTDIDGSNLTAMNRTELRRHVLASPVAKVADAEKFPPAEA
jgi:hypothetical protein